MQSVREVITKFILKSEGEEHLDKVEHKLDQIRERLEMFAAAEVVKGVYELTEKFAKFAESIHIAAANAGLTTDAFQELAFAAGQSGVNQDDMSLSMARLSRQLYEARIGSQQAQEAFMHAGFTQEQVLSFKTGKDALLGLADQFKNIQDPVQKLALAQELLGRGGARMVGFLSKGAPALKQYGIEAKQIGAVLGPKQVEELVEVEHAFTKMFQVIKVFGANIAAEFAPSLKYLVDKFIHFYEINQKVINLNMKKWAYDVTFALGFVWGIVEFVIQKFLNFAKAHEKITEAAFAAITVFSVLSFVITTLGFGLTGLKIAFSGVGWALNSIGGSVKWVIAQFWGLFAAQEAETAGALSTSGALGLMGTAALGAGAAADTAAIGITAMLWPVLLVVAGISALVVVCHDLWSLWNGGSFKDTWIGQAVDGIKSLGGKAMGLFGLGDDASAAKNAGSNLASAQALGDVGSAGIAAVGAGSGKPAAGAGEYTVNAPITITVPAGSDSKSIGKAAKEGVQQHLDRVYREVSRSLRSAEAY